MSSTLRKQLLFYQRQMMAAKDDEYAHEMYKNKTRELLAKLHEKEKASVAADATQNKIYFVRSSLTERKAEVNS